MTILRMHEQMTRLYQAAKELAKIEGQSALAVALNQSPQTVNNWEARGISKQGMLNAQARFGVSALWLDTGAGDMRATGGGLAGSLDVRAHDAEEMNLLLVYRLAKEHDAFAKGAIDAAVTVAVRRLDAAGRRLNKM